MFASVQIQIGCGDFIKTFDTAFTLTQCINRNITLFNQHSKRTISTFMAPGCNLSIGCLYATHYEGKVVFPLA